MDAAIKQQIIELFLGEMVFSTKTPLSLSAYQLSQYQALAELLDIIEQKTDTFIDLSQWSAPKNWPMLKDLLFYCVNFGKGNPPPILHINRHHLESRLKFWNHSSWIYRETRQNYSQSLTGLTNEYLRLLQPLVESFVNSKASINLQNPAQIDYLIVQLTAQLPSLEKGSQRAETIKKQLLLLEDIKKINQLSMISIPNEEGRFSDYCILAEAASGVTEKLSLIRFETLQEKVNYLKSNSITSVQTYYEHRKHLKLNTEAILKQPKHKDIREVQREAMALDISRLLGLNTTRSTMVIYQNKPALFVPFDNIFLLREYAKGKTFDANLGLTDQTYEHYATINPVGEGLAGEQFIEDFGSALGFMYLCNDTDVIGGYLQNKGLQFHKQLYIFDQVLMSDNKLGLDSRLSLQPLGFIMKNTRHGQGRNRTIIEDSAFVNKFFSIKQLQNRAETLFHYAIHIAHVHQKQRERIQQQLQLGLLTPQREKQLKEELKNAEILAEDALLISQTLKKRIDDIDKAFPTYNRTDIKDDTVCQAMILEKLLHNPVLFNDEGRPYRNPWTQRHHNPLLTLTVDNNNMVTLNFKDKIAVDILNFIKRHGELNSLEKISHKQLKLSINDLNKIHEKMLYPELHPFSLKHDYLNLNDLEILCRAYGSQFFQLKKVIISYQQTLSSNVSNADKITKINQTIQFLEHDIRTSKDKGFGYHVLKKLQFDIQKNLRKMILQNNMPPQLTLAFEAAVKLDRTSLFNQVMQQALLKNQINSKAFIHFLETCITQAKQTFDHKQALDSSEIIFQEAYQTLKQLEQPLRQLMSSPTNTVEEDELSSLNPVTFRLNELQKQHYFLEAAASRIGVKELIKDDNFIQKRPPSITISTN